MRKEFVRVCPEEVGIPSSAIEWLLDALESGFTEPHGLMIMRHGKVCAEGWWNPYAPGLRHGQQSHTKTYAATALGICYTEGLVKLDERIIDIFADECPEEISENLAKMTVRDVLCHGTGMKQQPRATQNWIHDFLSTPVVNEPGKAFYYNNVGSTLLGAIVRKKTGMGLHEYLKPRLFDKIGINADNLRWMYMPDGLEVGGGGLYCTTEDNLRLMKLYADGGVVDGERILAEDYVKMATSFQNDSSSEKAVNPPATDNFVGYGFQIWMCTPKGVYRADGAMGQFTIVVPDKDMIIAVTENAAGAHWAQKTLDVMWEFLTKIPETEMCAAPGEESAHLAQRLRRLSIPAPVFAPCAPVREAIDGVTYKITEGGLRFEEYVSAMFMGGIEEPLPAGSFSFNFKDDHCILRYTQGDAERCLTIGTDGQRIRNSIGEYVPAKQHLLSGAFTGENEFTIEDRRVETCCTKYYHFVFEGSNVTIHQESGMFFDNLEDIRAERENNG